MSKKEIREFAKQQNKRNREEYKNTSSYIPGLEEPPPQRVVIEKIEKGYTNELIPGIKKEKPECPPSLPQLPISLAAIGDTGKGKTNAVINLVKYYIDYGSINKVYIISPTYDNNEAFKILEAEDDDIYKGDQAQFNGGECINQILKQLKELAEDYDDYLEYCKAYAAYLKGKATLNQQTLVSNHQFQPMEFMEKPSPVIIMDDLSHTSIYSRSTDNRLNNLLLRHRHIYNIGVSLFMLVQNFKTGVPLMFRQNLKHFMLWKTHDTGQLIAIYEQVANNMSKRAFLTAFHEATKGANHHFFLIDLETDDPYLRYRRNFDECILFEETNKLLDNVK